MSSSYSRSPEGDFFYELDKSLKNEYSSQKMASFIADLLVAINNVEDDPDEGFGFHDEETDCWNGFDYFTPLPSNDCSAPHQTNVRKYKCEKRGANNISVDMFADEQNEHLLSEASVASEGNENNISVNIFDDGPLRRREAGAHDMSVEFDDAVPLQSLPVADIALILEKESRDVSIDMFAEFENDVDVMDADSIGSDETTTTKHFSVADCQNEESEDLERVTQMNGNINQQRSVGLFKNHDHQDERHLLTNEAPDTNVITKQKLPQHNVESFHGSRKESEENEADGHSAKILLCVPSNISYYEANENENTLGIVLQPSQIPSQRSFCFVTDFPEIISTKENLSQDGEQRILRPFDGNADTSMKSSCQSSLLRGFSPVAPLFQQPICASTKPDSDLSTTLCEEFEFSNNLVPNLRRSSSVSTVFRGFAEAAALTSQATANYNSMHGSSRSDNGTHSTFCEEYETDRIFAMYSNETQGDHINLEEAFTQCFSENQNRESGTEDRRQSFIDEIEKLVLKIQNDLLNRSKLAIEIPYRVSWKNCIVNNERLFLQPLSNGATRIIGSKRRIAMIVYVLSFVYKLLIKNETCTRREIYYSDPEFTHSQVQIDTAIMDICFFLNAPPWEIGILSSSKGLIAGSIKLTLNDDTILDVESIDGGILLPQQTMTVKKVETAARFVLLVEKHTIYEKLLLENVLNRLGPCIMITGKGYPDINTRAMLKRISDDCKCPIYALVDADPHGIQIMLSYRHGSRNMSFFNGSLAIPSIRWIGVFPSEIKKFNLQSVSLTERDANLIDSLMKRPYLSTKIYEELLVLKKMQKKSEVEALLSSGVVDCIHSHLLHKIQSGGYI